MIQPFVVTLLLDSATFERLNGLRRRYFPPERNYLSAHVTLFHQLPGEQLDVIVQTLTAVSAAVETMPITFLEVRHLGRGVAIDVACKPLMNIRARLADAWQLWLTVQDRQGFRPHVTVQNKVGPAESRVLYDQLRVTWTPLIGTAAGLQLWRYHGGPWVPVTEFRFAQKVNEAPVVDTSG